MSTSPGAVSAAIPRPRSPLSSGPADPSAKHGHGRRLRAAADRYGPALGVYGLVKLAGFTTFMLLLNDAGDYLGKHPRFGGGARPWDVLASWDGWWYQQVAQYGYHPQLVPVVGQGAFTVQENSAAFFPLYPGLMRLVSDCTGLGLYGAGMLVSVLTSFAAAAGIFGVTTRLGGARAGLIAAALWGLAPGSGVEWALYSDSTFVALAAWACYTVMTGRWLTAGSLTLVAGLNRPTAAALVAALGVAGLIALYRRTDGIARPLAAITMAPLGLLGYVGWVGWRMGDWGGYFKLQRGAWMHYFDWGASTLNTVFSVLYGHRDYQFVYPVEDLVAMAVLIALPVLVVLLLRLRPPAVLVVYTLVTIVTALGSQQIFGNTSRYLLPAFPLLIPLALALRRLSLRVLVTVLGTTALASGWFAGYVLFELGVP
ncbi:hypothetical protein [Kitasatospora sp. NPDC050543]|uniref:hypothetical protein n=1 Tax=Kitasatospora sp. NPDC050543 TaxID=3364054 RepID=UPI003793FD4A